nr:MULTISPECIES: transposase [Bacillus cereus group]
MFAECGRKVHVELNKGESKHALAQAVFFNRFGEIRVCSYEDQLHRASSLQHLCYSFYIISFIVSMELHFINITFFYIRRYLYM